jgi:serine/threonine-protein kinase RsbW
VAPIELHLPPQLQYVGLARLIVCAAARQAGMHGERVEDLRIAVSEATTNAVVAQRRVDEGTPVVLRFGEERGAFEVTIMDGGPGFDPAAPGSNNGRDWSTEGGLGVTIIRELADDVRFVRGEGMHVSVSFALDLPGGIEHVERPPSLPGHIQEGDDAAVRT